MMQFSESVLKITKEAESALREVWQEVGTETKDRMRVLDMLQASVQEKFDVALRQETAGKQALMAEVDALQRQHAELVKCLQQAEPENQWGIEFNLTGPPLLQQKQSLEEKVAMLTIMRTARMQDLQQIQRDLNAVYAALDTPEDQRRPIFDDLSRFSAIEMPLPLTLVQDYQNELNARRQEKRELDINKVQSLVKEIVLLNGKLKKEATRTQELQTRHANLVEWSESEILEDAKTLESELSVLKQQWATKLHELVSNAARVYADRAAILNQFAGGASAVPPLAEELLAEENEKNLAAIERLSNAMQSCIDRAWKMETMLNERAAILFEAQSITRRVEESPKRLCNKSRSMAAEILRQDRIRSVVRNRLPFMDRTLLRYAAEWRRDHQGVDFLFKGQTVAQILDANRVPSDVLIRAAPIVDSGRSTTTTPKKRPLSAMDENGANGEVGQPTTPGSAAKKLKPNTPTRSASVQPAAGTPLRTPVRAQRSTSVASQLKSPTRTPTREKPPSTKTTTAATSPIIPFRSPLALTTRTNIVTSPFLAKKLESVNVITAKVVTTPNAPARSVSVCFPLKKPGTPYPKRSVMSRLQPNLKLAAEKENFLKSPPVHNVPVSHSPVLSPQRRAELNEMEAN